MALKSQYMVVAEHVRDGTRGKFDLLGPFDRIFARAVPAQHAGLTVVVLLYADSEDDLGSHSFRLRFYRPNGQPMFEQAGDFKVKAESGSWLGAARFNFVFQGLVLPDWGKYRFILEVDGAEVAAHPLTVAPLTDQSA